ncbi:hypothetical protein Pvag_0131 [Pantoea vagans C9-1]|nr:hypothetical protein Pvag_0131 [Pantoea vagans C9-1]
MLIKKEPLAPFLWSVPAQRVRQLGAKAVNFRSGML